MISFLVENIGTIIVLAVLIGIVFGIIYSRKKAKKNGKSGCGCGCSSCAMAGTCHSNATKK